MIYLKDLDGQVEGYKDQDTKTIKQRLDLDGCIRVMGLKDPTPYSEPKKESKKKSK